MNFLSLLTVEWKKLRRSRILLILGIATVMLWIPSVLNADLNFGMQAEGSSYKYGEAVPGKIHDLAGACCDPDLDDDGNVLYKRCNCVTDAGL